jgi:hypothetical protein
MLGSLCGVYGHAMYAPAGMQDQLLCQAMLRQAVSRLDTGIHATGV